MFPSRLGIVALAASGLAFVASALAGEVVAGKSLTVQPAGVRSGRTGELYFNVEGKKNGEGGKYASFGILEFPAADVAAALKDSDPSLALSQSVARFSVDGKIKLYLATGDFETQDLKFERANTDGLPSQVGSKAPIGSGDFKKAETARVDVLSLTLDDASRKYVEGRAAKGESIRIIMVPDDESVAATYFGSGADDAARKPKLTAGAKK